MTHRSTLRLALVFITSTIATAAHSQKPENGIETWTGWFSDNRCARVTNDTPRPNGTACVKKCLSEGATPVFISEQAKGVYEVRDYSSVNDDVGYYVQVTGIVNPTAKTISVQSVKRLSEVVTTCARPTKRDKKQ